jgi:plasmid stabilization system protein ParE
MEAISPIAALSNVESGVNKMALPVKWRKQALKQFDEAIAYIEKDSLQNAIKVEQDLLSAISKLSQYPERYNKDKSLVSRLE